MNRISKFDSFIYEEAGTLAAAGSKMRRVVTGQSAGDEIQKLSDSQQKKLISLYREDPTEAARYLRSIIIKEKNSQFGLGLALTIAGAGMIYKAANYEPPKPEPKPEPDPVDPDPVDPSEDYVVQRGDSWWKIAKEHLPADASNKEIMSYAKQIASDNGAEHLYSGKFGSPGLKPDTWTDLASGREVGRSVITGEDRLFPDEVIKINPFKGAKIPTID